MTKRKRFVRLVYQKVMTTFLLSHERCNLYATMGSGKTGATLWALNQMFKSGELGPKDRVLVLAPLRVASATWPGEQDKWGFPALQVVDGTGPVAYRQQVLAGRDNVVCCNYDIAEWLVQYLGDDWPFTVVVADESTKLKSFRTRGGSKRARALGKIAHKKKGVKVRYWWNLTGTPATNGLKDLWGQNWFIDAGARLGTSFTAFKDRYFTSKQKADSKYAVDLIPMPRSEQRIHRALADISLTVDASKYFGCEEAIVVPRPVYLPRKAQKVYDDMVKLLKADLDEGKVDAVNAAAKTAKCLQIASGAVYVTDADGEPTGDWELIHNEKLDALESIYEELNGAPLLVAYYYRHDRERILKKFPEAVALGKGKTATRNIELWNQGKIPMLLAHPASAGHGLNLQDGGHHLAVFSDTWNLEYYSQIVERIGPVRQHQAGHPRPVFVFLIQAAGTLDEVVAERRTGKKSVQDLLMAYMERKN